MIKVGGSTKNLKGERERVGGWRMERPRELQYTHITYKKIQVMAQFTKTEEGKTYGLLGHGGMGRRH